MWYRVMLMVKAHATNKKVEAVRAKSAQLIITPLPLIEAFFPKDSLKIAARESKIFAARRWGVCIA